MRINVDKVIEHQIDVTCEDNKNHLQTTKTSYRLQKPPIQTTVVETSNRSNFFNTK